MKLNHRFFTCFPPSSIEPVLFHSMILTLVSLLISIAYQKVSKVYYSSLRKKRSATKFTRDTEEFLNPKITKVEVTVQGMPNELYAQNMVYRHQNDEIVKHFAEGRLKEAGAIQKDLQLHNVNIASYYTNK